MFTGLPVLPGRDQWKQTKETKVFVAPWSENVLMASCGNNLAPVSIPSHPCSTVSALLPSLSQLALPTPH